MTDERTNAMNHLEEAVGGAVRVAVDELIRATNLHPHWPSDPLHAVAILAEEMGELTQKLLQATYEPKKGVTVDDIREEAVQVAAMGLRFLVNFHRYHFPAAKRQCGSLCHGNTRCLLYEGHDGPHV